MPRVETCCECGIVMPFPFNGRSVILGIAPWGPGCSDCYLDETMWREFREFLPADAKKVRWFDGAKTQKSPTDPKTDGA